MTELTTLQMLMIEQEIQEIGDQIMALHKSYKAVLSEAVDDFYSEDGDLDFMFEEGRKRFQAARQAIGFINKLPPDQRRAQRSRVTGFLNKLRAINARIDKAIAKLVQSAQIGDGVQANPMGQQQAPQQAQTQQQPPQQQVPQQQQA